MYTPMAEAFSTWWGIRTHAMLSRLEQLSVNVAEIKAGINCEVDASVIQATHVALVSQSLDFDSNSSSRDMLALRTECKKMVECMARMDTLIKRMNERVRTIERSIDDARREMKHMQENALRQLHETTHPPKVASPIPGYRPPPANIRMDGTSL